MSHQPTKISDSVLVDLIVKEGRIELKNVIYKRYSQKVYFRCLSIVHDSEMAKDLTQDVLLKVFSNLSQFKGKSTFNMWVRAITFNYCIDYLRKRKRMYFEEYQEEKLENMTTEDNTIAAKQLLEERSEILKTLICDLKVKDQAVIKMRYYEGRSIKEISDAIGSGVSATKMRLKRAKERLIEKAHQMQLVTAA